MQQLSNQVSVETLLRNSNGTVEAGDSFLVSTQLHSMDQPKAKDMTQDSTEVEEISSPETLLSND
jgi:hypothetical protein